MSKRRIFGIVIGLIGVVAILASMYIKQQVEEGKGKVGKAQKKIEQGKTLFSLSPATKGVGQGISGAAEKKIGEANEQIAYYARLSSQLEIGGIIFLVIGGGMVLMGGKKKRR